MNKSLNTFLYRVFVLSVGACLSFALFIYPGKVHAQCGCIATTAWAGEEEICYADTVELTGLVEEVEVTSHIEDFESESTCATSCGSACSLSGPVWEQVSSDDMDWTVNSGTTGSNNTGPNGDHTTGSGNYIYLEASGTACNNATGILRTQDWVCISEVTEPLSYWYHMYGDPNMGNLYVEIDTGTGWFIVDELLGQQQSSSSDPWQNRQVDIGSIVSAGLVRVQFRGVTGGGYESDMSLDDIEWPGATWTEDSNATYFWEPDSVIVGPQGDTAAQTTYAVLRENTTFTLYGSSAGCTATDQVSVEVDSTHVRTSPLMDTTICAGDSIKLDASIVGIANTPPQTVQLGSGTTVNGTTTASPVNIYFRRTVMQFVYTAAELNAAGISGGPLTLTEIGFYVTQSPLYDIPDYTISMGNVTQTNVASPIPASDLSTVYYDPLYTPVAGGYEMLTLNTPFVWDGVSNIGVEICWSQVQPTYDASGQVRTYPETNGFRYSWTDAAGSSCGAVPASTLNNKPQVQFVLSGSGVVSKNCLKLEEDFAAGIDPKVWSSVENGTVGNLCNSYSGSQALQFSGSGMRQATTRALEVSRGGFVEFYLKISQGTSACSGCNEADNGEGVMLECSVDGGSSWIPMEDYAYDSSPEFTFYTVNIPDTAHTDTTYLRWRQKAHSGTCNDNWALDEVRVLGPGECALSWSPHASLSDSVGTPYAFPTQSTTYEVTYNSDPKICRYTDTVRVNVEGPEVSLDGVEAATCGADNGSASVMASGGVSPYDFQWNDPNNQTTPTANDLPAGAYQVSVTDAAGCQNKLTVAIDSIPEPEITVDAIVEASCPTSTDGAAYISVSEGTSPYSYEWTTGDQDDYIEDVVPQTYHVTVTDADDCAVTRAVEVPGPDPLIVFASGQAPSSQEAEDGIVWVQVAGGTYPYNIKWNDESGQTGDTAKNLGVGTYTVRITDDKGCVKEAQVVLSMTTDVQQVDANRTLAYYPNPASHTLHIEYTQPEPQPVAVRIVNPLGQVMQERDYHAAREISDALDISSLNNGLYFLQLKPEHESAILRKVVIQNR